MFSTLSLRRPAHTLFGCLLAAASFLLPGVAAGQTVVYSGVQTTVYSQSSYSYTPPPIAADGAGDVFFVLRQSETYNLEEVQAGQTSLTLVKSNIGFNPTAIAVNHAGTQISVIYSGSSQECPNGENRSSIHISSAALGGNSVAFSDLPCSFSMSGSNDRYTTASGVAYDSSGILYIADSGAHVLYGISSGTTPTSALQLNDGSDPINLAIAADGRVELLLDNGATNGVGYVATSQFEPNLSGTNGNPVTPTSIITGLDSHDTTVAVDALDNAYVSNTVEGPVRKIVNGSTLKIDSRFGDGVYGLTSDASGNLYASGSNSSANLFIGEDSQLNSGNFGNVQVGQSQSYTYTFTFSAAETVVGVSAVIQGASGLDYQKTGSGGSVCAAQAYASGATCTVTVQFSPKYPGLRSGAIVFTQADNAVLGTAYLQGIGTGAAVTFNPGVSGTFASDFDSPTGMASDSAGNLYLPISSTGIIEKVSAQGTSTAVSGLTAPFSVAIDGAGNLYVTNAADEVLEIAPNGSRTTVASGLNHPGGLAVDGSGTLYIAANGNGSIVRVPAGGTASTWISVTNPDGIAVDGLGNVYVTANSDEVLKITSSGTQSTAVSGLNEPTDVAVDSAGDLYISTDGSSSVIESPTGCANADCLISMGTGESGLSAVALDGQGNVYAVQLTSNADIFKIDRADAPSFSFATTNVGSTSSDSPQSFELQNTGNSTLSAISPGLTVGTDFQQVSGSGTPADCSATFSLNPGTLCNISVSFEPTVAGDLQESLVLTDNALNGSPATQTISLAGTARGTPTITWATPAPISYGTALSAVQLNATANVAGSFVYAPPAGTILTAGIHPLNTNFTPTDTANYNTQVGSVQITVNKRATTVSLNSSTMNANLGTQITFTAVVQSGVSEIPTGSVEFLDGSTVLGASPVNGQGTATYVTSSLTAGSHSINAVYSGDGNFFTSSNMLSQMVTAPAYSITATPTALTLAAGQSGTVNLTFIPVGGFTGKIVLICNGLPDWAQCQANPQVLTADGSNTQQTAQLLITTLGPNSGTVNNIASNERGGPGNGSRVATASLFFLPALLLGGFLAWERKKLGTGWKSVLMLLVLVSTMSGMVGCGFSNASTSQGAYTVTVTGTSSATSQTYTGPANETVNFTLTITR